MIECGRESRTRNGCGIIGHPCQGGRQIRPDDPVAAGTVDPAPGRAGHRLEPRDRDLQHGRHLVHRSSRHLAVRRRRRGLLGDDHHAGHRVLLRPGRRQLAVPRAWQTQRGTCLTTVVGRFLRFGGVRRAAGRSGIVGSAPAGSRSGRHRYNRPLCGAVPDAAAGRHALRHRLVHDERPAALPGVVRLFDDRSGHRGDPEHRSGPGADLRRRSGHLRRGLGHRDLPDHQLHDPDRDVRQGGRGPAVPRDGSSRTCCSSGR